MPILALARAPADARRLPQPAHRRHGLDVLPELPPGSVDMVLCDLPYSDHIDADLCHALLNSAVGLFLVEALGFGRGLGALDPSTTRAKRQPHSLNSRRLNEKQQRRVTQAFRPLLDRPVETVPEELARDDRRAFDRTVLGAFGLLGLYEPIRTALHELYALRMAAND